MTNSRKGPSGGAQKFVQFELDADVAQIALPQIQRIDVIKIVATTTGTFDVAGLVPGRHGQKIQILIESDAGGLINITSNDNAAPEGSRWYRGPNFSDLGAPSNFNATYDRTALGGQGAWWCEGLIQFN